MDTDERLDFRKSAESKLLLRQETHQIIGCAFEVINTLGHGFHEKVYENALVVELGLNGILFNQQKRFPVAYKGIQVSEYIPDLVVFDSIIVDAKVIDQITDFERGQMINYLRVTKLRVALVLNFKHSKLQWERIIL